jgi:hypothetical protein
MLAHAERFLEAEAALGMTRGEGMMVLFPYLVVPMDRMSSTHCRFNTTAHTATFPSGHGRSRHGAVWQFSRMGGIYELTVARWITLSATGSRALLAVTSQ